MIMDGRTHAPLSQGEVWGGSVLVVLGGGALLALGVLAVLECTKARRRRQAAATALRLVSIAAMPQARIGFSLPGPRLQPPAPHRVLRQPHAVPRALSRPGPYHTGSAVFGRIPPATLVPLRAGTAGGLVVDRRRWR